MKLNSCAGEKPLWSQLYDILESKILSGEYAEGTSFRKINYGRI